MNTITAKGWFWSELGFTLEEVEQMCQEELVEPSVESKELTVVYNAYFEDD